MCLAWAVCLAWVPVSRRAYRLLRATLSLVEIWLLVLEPPGPLEAGT